jgi:zinc protease
MTAIEKLENGLSIYLKEIHTAPIISHWIWYRVGSRNEQPGKTGISHWVEHMQFKGTNRFPAGMLDRAISRDGGLWNAFTNLDWTAYFQVMPSDKIEIALELEADRMKNSLFEADEVESERTVILSERDGSENEPLFRLSEAVQKAAFDHHPYRFEIIGEKEDLLSITRDDLYHHYQQNYSPANALISIAGDFDSQAMREKLNMLYRDIPLGSTPAQAIQPESFLSSERHVELEGAGGTTYLQLAYRAPAAHSDDFFDLTVLDSLLTGPSSLNMFGGGGVSNRTSRLYRALVEHDFAVAVNGSLQATIDPFLYTILVVVHPQQQVENVISELDAQIDKILQNKVDTQEIERSVKQAKALFAYTTESVTNQAFWLGYSEMFAKYDWFMHYIEALEKINPERVLKAARKYLDPVTRVTGIYRPLKSGAAQ